jgi:hypothetical protein
MKLLGILPLVLLVPPAAAQSFNIDVGTNLILFPEPAPTYAGGANQAGTWNRCINPYSTALVNLDGSASTATTASDQSGWYNFFPSTLTGDDYNLMVDIQSFGDSISNVTANWTFAGLQDGDYAVYTYAWDPQNNGTLNLVHVPGSTDLPQNVGGIWGGSPHALGVTYALHHVTVSGGTFTVEVSNSAGHAGSVNAFQLVRTGGGVSTAFCFGDGTSTACPCGNVGSAGHGCPSSVNPAGALIAGQGTPSLAADTVALHGSGMPDSSALYFQGTTQQSGGAGAQFGDGLRCAGGSVIRLGTKINAAGASHYPVAGDPSVSVKGNVTSPGTRTYQVWYRNAASFCTPSTFNLSNGLMVVWVP